MLKIRRLLVFLLIILSLLPAYSINIWLQKVIQPRRSFGRLLLYMLTGSVLVFLYTFLLVLLISKLFPVAKG